MYIYLDMYKSTKIKVDLYSFCCRNARQRAAQIYHAHGLRAHVAEKEKKYWKAVSQVIDLVDSLHTDNHTLTNRKSHSFSKSPSGDIYS